MRDGDSAGSENDNDRSAVARHVMPDIHVARQSSGTGRRNVPVARRVPIDLWYLPLNDFSEEGACLSLLDSGERQRHDGFKSDSARRQYLAARALLRTTLSRYRDIAPEDWRFATNRYGRPFIHRSHGIIDLHFSVSHTHGMVLCAVGGVAELGVDIEHPNRANDLDALARAVLAPSEQARFAAMTDDRRSTFFFTLWTLKEAYVKARGMGMSLPMNGVCFDVDALQPSVHFTSAIADEASRWTFRSIHLMDHLAGIAVSPSAGVDVLLMQAKPVNLD